MREEGSDDDDDVDDDDDDDDDDSSSSGKTAENINMGEPRISETQIETGTAGNY